MAVEAVPSHDALVFRDRQRTWRWYDAIGPGVVKYVNEFVTAALVSGTPVDLYTTLTGVATAIYQTDEAGGVMVISTGDADGNGANLQLGSASGESVKLDGDYPLYCGVKLKINDVDQTTLFFGLGVTDTAWSGGLTDGLYFTSADESASLSYVCEKDSVESSAVVATLADDTYVTLEIYFDGSSAYAYVDGTQVGVWATTKATFPDDEELRLTLEFKTGEAFSNTCTIDWIRLVHLRGS